MAFIIFNHIRCHLQGRIQNHPVSKLFRQCCIHTAVSFILIVPFLATGRIFGVQKQNIKRTRCIIQRTGQHTGERQHDMMKRRISFAPCIPFHPSHSFTCHHIRPCTTDTGIFNRFVRIQRHFVTGSCFHHFLIVVDPILAVMKITIRESSRISCLKDMDTVVCVPLHSMIHLALIVGNIPSGLVMADNFNSFFLCITNHFINVKVSIRFRKVKVLHTTPAFPAFIPTFKQNAFNLIGSGKINVFLGIDSSGSMTFIHLPGFYAEMHPPPYTYIFHRTNPIGRFYFTWFIQI